jgi:uncharacterized protein YdaU (DUF1376 family)
MSLPYMKLYVSDYFGDTRHMSTEQSGAYLHLLMSMWLSGGFIPGDERSLAKLSGLSLRQWRRVRDPIEALLMRDGDMVTQRRLLSERQEADDKCQKKVAAGKASAKAKALKAKPSASTDVGVLLEQNDQQNAHNQNQNQNQNKKEKEPPAVAGALVAAVPAIVLPAWISPEAWQGYCDMRKRKRAPLTDRAKRLVLKELEKLKLQGHDPNAVLDQSAQNAWTAVYPLKSHDTKHAKQSANYNFISAAAAYVDEQFHLAGDSGDTGPDSSNPGGIVLALPPT